MSNDIQSSYFTRTLTVFHYEAQSSRKQTVTSVKNVQDKITDYR
jgi:hypothetical protein